MLHKGLKVKARIYHNARCSKSRAALALLESHGTPFEVVDYLREPLDRAALEQLLAKLDAAPLELVRTAEPEYRAFAAALGRTPTAVEVLDLLASTPALLQRPVVELGDRALIARPPERVRELLD